MPGRVHDRRLRFAPPTCLELNILESFFPPWLDLWFVRYGMVASNAADYVRNLLVTRQIIDGWLLIPLP